MMKATKIKLTKRQIASQAILWMAILITLINLVQKATELTASYKYYLSIKEQSELQDQFIGSLENDGTLIPLIHSNMKLNRLGDIERMTYDELERVVINSTSKNLIKPSFLDGKTDYFDIFRNIEGDVIYINDIKQNNIYQAHFFSRDSDLHSVYSELASRKRLAENYDLFDVVKPTGEQDVVRIRLISPNAVTMGAHALDMYRPFYRGPSHYIHNEKCNLKLVHIQYDHETEKGIMEVHEPMCDRLTFDIVSDPRDIYIWLTFLLILLWSVSQPIRIEK